MSQKAYDEAAKRELERQANEKMENARSVMILHKKPTNVFFAGLIMKMIYQHSWDIDSCSTDGKYMRYNPDFMMFMPPLLVRGVHAKMVVHNMMHHPQMLAKHQELDADKLRVAMDLVANDLLSACGFELTKEAIVSGKKPFQNITPGMTTMEIYRLLPDGLGGVDPSNPSGMGGVSEAKSEDGGRPSSEELDKQISEQNMRTSLARSAAKMRGDISMDLDLLIEDMTSRKVHWREKLRDWCSKSSKQEYSWNKLNRRHISRGVYLPSQTGQTTGTIIIANDTSGSMEYKDRRSACAAEIQALAEQMQCEIIILHHDCKICSVQEWSPEDGQLKLAPRGGGGTSHLPVFEWIDSNFDKADGMAGLICMTDMETCFPNRAPDYPVLWAAVGSKGSFGPFGQTIHIDDE